MNKTQEKKKNSKFLSFFLNGGYKYFGQQYIAEKAETRNGLKGVEEETKYLNRMEKITFEQSSFIIHKGLQVVRPLLVQKISFNDFMEGLKSNGIELRIEVINYLREIYKSQTSNQKLLFDKTDLMIIQFRNERKVDKFIPLKKNISKPSGMLKKGGFFGGLGDVLGNLVDAVNSFVDAVVGVVEGVVTIVEGAFNGAIDAWQQLFGGEINLNQSRVKQPIVSNSKGIFCTYSEGELAKINWTSSGWVQQPISMYGANLYPFSLINIGGGFVAGVNRDKKVCMTWGDTTNLQYAVLEDTSNIIPGSLRQSQHALFALNTDNKIVYIRYFNSTFLVKTINTFGANIIPNSLTITDDGNHICGVNTKNKIVMTWEDDSLEAFPDGRKIGFAVIEQSQFIDIF